MTPFIERISQLFKQLLGKQPKPEINRPERHAWAWCGTFKLTDFEKEIQASQEKERADKLKAEQSKISNQTNPAVDSEKNTIVPGASSSHIDDDDDDLDELIFSQAMLHSAYRQNMKKNGLIKVDIIP